jgi:hypothetical protein
MGTIKEGFFDEYDEFLKTSKTAMFLNQLNHRYKALIEYNREIISDNKILDLASHDGRFSFAAIKNGASFVCGIEARKHLVDASNKNMEKYNIPREKYSYIRGDIFDEIKKIKSGDFDVIFCFGIFYHIMNHTLLLSEIKRLNPKYLILDTRVMPSPAPIIKVLEKDPEFEGHGIQDSINKNKSVLEGVPSKALLELILKNYNFSFKYYDWQNSGITDWKDMINYRDGHRITIVAKNLDYS